jgi:hypothetical protein
MNRHAQPIIKWRLAMHDDGDDASRCSNGLSAQVYRAATTEERAVYRKWIRGTVVFYSTILLISGFAMIVSYSNNGLTRLTTLSSPSVTAAARTN